MSELERRAVSRRRVLGFMAAGGLTLASAGLLAACGSDDESEPTATPVSGGASAPTGTPANSGTGAASSATTPAAAATATDASAEPTATATTEPVAADVPDEFIVASPLEPTDLLPWFGGYEQGLITRQIYQTLIEPRLTLDESGVVQVELVPQLAESWELAEPTVWRFHLRPDVSFHNGEPLTAEAIKVSFDTLSDEALVTQYNKSNILALFTGCEVVDELTVELTTAVPNAEAPQLYLRIGLAALPPQFLAEHGIEGLAETPIGTGPYQFVSWERGQEVLVTRFEEYWNPDGPNMPNVRYIFRPEAAVRAQTIKAGEAHFAYNIGSEQAQALDHYVVGGGFQSSSIRLNNTIAPTNDLAVRQAINYAIDRAAIVEAIFGGAAVPLAFFGFQPVQLEPFPYDPEQAAELLQEAGAQGAELELVYGEGRIPEEDQLAEIYQAALQAIGLNVTLTKVERQQYADFSAAPFAEQPQMLMETTSSGNFGDVASGLQDKYGCDGTGTFCDPAFDAEFAALLELQGEERNAALQDIAERLHNEVTPRCWVVAVQQVHGLAPNVATTLPDNAYILFDDIRFA